jgi:hypothetical protein
MTGSKAIWLAVISLAFYACGALCIFRTSMLVGWAQKNYTKSKFVQAYPFSGMVMKPWYPTYIRAAGIFIWLWALAIDYLVLFRGFR